MEVSIQGARGNFPILTFILYFSLLGSAFWRFLCTLMNS